MKPKRTRGTAPSSELAKLRTFYELKKTYRMNSVEHRKESSAEHTWSCLVLAEYIFSKMPARRKHHIDLPHVRELLLYHDVVEIEAGDIPVHHEHDRAQKEADEMAAAHVLVKRFPAAVGKAFLSCFKEFEAQRTVESRLAKAIDRLDAQVHELDYRRDWKGWTEAMLRKYAGAYAQEFPETRVVFEEIAKAAHRGKYFAEDGNV